FPPRAGPAVTVGDPVPSVTGRLEIRALRVGFLRPPKGPAIQEESTHDQDHRDQPRAHGLPRVCQSRHDDEDDADQYRDHADDLHVAPPCGHELHSPAMKSRSTRSRDYTEILLARDS